MAATAPPDVLDVPDGLVAALWPRGLLEPLSSMLATNR